MPRNNLKPIIFLIVALALTLRTECQTSSRRSTISASQIAKNTLPSVVAVIAEDSQGDTIFGSGFFIGTNLIATNYHVVKNASRITVKLVAQKKRFLIENVVAVDEEKDLAILKVGGLTARPLTLGLTNPIIGEEIYVVGNPEGFEGTFSQGIVSGRRRESMLQITAPKSHGSSGAPVLNKRGEVIGIVIGTLAEGQNLNFAISASELAAFKKAALLEYGVQAVASDIPPLPYKLPNLREIDAIVSREKGDKYFREGLLAEAVKEYEQAIGMSPKDAEAQLGLANAYSALSNYPEAIAGYKRAIKLEPDNSFTYIKLGEIYEKLRRTDEAIHTYKQAILISPSNTSAYFDLSNLYESRHEYDKVVGLWNQKALVDPQAFDFIMLGGIYEKTFRYQDAIDAYSRAVAIDINNERAHFRLGELYLKLGNRDLADQKYQFLRILKSRYADELLRDINK